MNHKTQLTPADIDAAGVFDGHDLVVPGDLEISARLGTVIIRGDLTVGWALTTEPGTSLVIGGSLRVEGPVWIRAGDLEVAGSITTGESIACDGGRVVAGRGLHTADPRLLYGD